MNRMMSDKFEQLQSKWYLMIKKPVAYNK